MSEIEWGAPPPTQKRGKAGDAAAFIEALRERPGEWAKHPKPFANGSVTTHYTRRYPGTEWTSRIRPDRRVDVFARWIGNGDGAA